jgi:uncharacterized membrane protein
MKPNITLLLWAIGISMIVLSGIIYLPRHLMLLVGILLIAAHHLLDTVHVQGDQLPAILWSMLHDARRFTFDGLIFYVRYPVLPWIGIMIVGYYLGRLYTQGYDALKRRKLLFSLGIGAIVLFIILRFYNWYGDPAEWSIEKNSILSLLSFLNVTKYPPSLLYILITLGPALVLLAGTEKPMNSWMNKIVIFGRVPMFYYLAHILLIHILAVIAAVITGYPSMIILSNPVNDTATLRGYGFNLTIVYIIWIGLIFLLYPLCKWFESYRRNYQTQYWWLSYL